MNLVPPAEAEDRTMLGHWEGDLIISGTNSQIATLVDRASRKVDLVQLANRSAEHLTSALSQRRTQQSAVEVKTLTWDRGMELADHQTLTQATGIEIVSAHPLSQWQRGTNENTNGLIHQ